MIVVELRLRLAAIGIAAAVFCAIAYAAFALRPTPLLTGLVLTRAALLPVVLLPALIAALAALALRQWTLHGRVLDLLRFALFAAALALLALTSAETIWGALVLACLIFGALSGSPALQVRLDIPALRSAVVPAFLFGAVGLAIPLALLPAKWREAYTAMPKPDGPEWTQVTMFLKNEVEPGRMALMPPYPYAMVSARQASPTDYGQMGYSIYARWLLKLEFDQLRQLFGIDLRGHDPASVTRWLAERGGLLCLLEHGYMELASDPVRLRALKETYPTLAYVVAPKDGVLPEGWTCGPVKARSLPLETAFENASYVVYRLDRQ